MSFSFFLVFLFISVSQLVNALCGPEPLAMAKERKVTVSLAQPLPLDMYAEGILRILYYSEKTDGHDGRYLETERELIWQESEKFMKKVSKSDWIFDSVI